ncbi:hypothetical protein pb186bvf_009676 [Paramecium bursaria]
MSISSHKLWRQQLQYIQNAQFFQQYQRFYNSNINYEAKQSISRWRSIQSFSSKTKRIIKYLINLISVIENYKLYAFLQGIQRIQKLIISVLTSNAGATMIRQVNKRIQYFQNENDAFLQITLYFQLTEERLEFIIIVNDVIIQIIQLIKNLINAILISNRLQKEMIQNRKYISQNFIFNTKKQYSISQMLWNQQGLLNLDLICSKQLENLINNSQNLLIYFAQ